MRLINVDTLEMKEFPNHEEVLFAILSHTWEEEEITFQDFSDASNYPLNPEFSHPRLAQLSRALSSMKGYPKLIDFCKKAKAEGFQWAWMDTCCINKTSSSELSEAINAMYAWYQDSGLCYAYLSDVRSDQDPTLHDSDFRKSRWFTRGWTLQELIAPSEVVFFGSDWKEIGNRRSLSNLVSEITGIPEPVLHDSNTRHDYSLAQRMSWASRRRTTRIEDNAYCLLGIFDINMPLLYGERGKAFFRLQSAILSRSDDLSLLAWQIRYMHPETEEPGFWRFAPDDVHGPERSNILSTSIADFRYAGDIKKIPEHIFGQASQEDALIRRGLYIKISGQMLKLEAPVFGPLHSDGAHRGGLAKVLSPEARKLLCAVSSRYTGAPLLQRTPLNNYVRSDRYIRWKDIIVILVGMIAPQEIKSPSEPSSPVPSYPEECFVGILLDRSTSPIRRLQWPPLIRVDLTQGYFEGPVLPALRSWPLTSVHVPITPTDQKERNITPLLKMGPANYVMAEWSSNHEGENKSSSVESDDGNVPLDPRGLRHLRFEYRAGHAPQRIMKRLPYLITFSGGIFGPEDLTIQFQWRFRTDWKAPVYHVVVAHPDDDVSKHLPCPIGLEDWAKTYLPISETKALSMQRRLAANDELELWDIDIEDIPAALPLPPFPTSRMSSQDTESPASLVALPETEVDWLTRAHF